MTINALDLGATSARVIYSDSERNLSVRGPVCNWWECGATVKSLRGEPVQSATSGMAGDREWGIRDERTGKILTARRVPNR